MCLPLRVCVLRLFVGVSKCECGGTGISFSVCDECVFRCICVCVVGFLCGLYVWVMIVCV